MDCDMSRVRGRFGFGFPTHFITFKYFIMYALVERAHTDRVEVRVAV